MWNDVVSGSTFDFRTVFILSEKNQQDLLLSAIISGLLGGYTYACNNKYIKDLIVKEIIFIKVLITKCNKYKLIIFYYVS